LSVSCHHCIVEHEEASVLARDGNWAVVHLSGRRFPGVHVQGDTFAALQAQLLGATRALRRNPADPDALAELDAAVAEIDALLGYYEHVLADHGISIPY
jgi:hypothetical protein